MNYILTIILRIFIILLAILLGALLFTKIIDPYILQNLCLTNSNSCLRIAYWNYKNSVLFHMEPIGYWVWFNGTKAFVYDVINGAVCTPGIDGTIFSPVFPIEPIPTAKPESWECIQNVDSLIHMYENKFGASKQFIWKNIKPVKKTVLNENGKNVTKTIKGPINLSVYDILNIFVEKNIINLENI